MYQAPEILYGFKKVGLKAVFVNHKHGKQNYYDILLSVVPELATSTDRVVVSAKLEHLRTVVVKGDVDLP